MERIGVRIRREILGENRAGYGEQIVHALSAQLRREFRCGFSVTNLRNFRQFFLVFPRGCCKEEIPPEEIGYTVCSGLSWSQIFASMKMVASLPDPQPSVTTPGTDQK